MSWGIRPAVAVMWVLTTALFWGCGATPSSEPEASRAAAPRPAAPPKKAQPRRGREAVAASAELLRTARQTQGSESYDDRCGPYRLVTDVRDPKILADCRTLAAALDKAYRQTLGLSLVGKPAEVIFLFADRSAYRAFTAQQAGVAQGNAGYADGTRGYLAMPVGEQARRKIRSTLVHELSHLLHRRSLGPNLPPWLSEGLADLMGDAAAAGQLEDVLAAPREADEAKRLRWGYSEGQVGNVERLVGLRRSEFDRQTVSYDYEHSAALARFLLTDPRYGAGFKKYLKRLAKRGPYDPKALSQALGASWSDVDVEFRKVVSNYIRRSEIRVSLQGS